ncbi:uncharacterized protein [Apostichopus japonicus]|uniref:uncharacterized protein isoform X4 n=1 Tax=Stichopus japonicus TaxID=307972 RepID=UPI003AB1BF43
MSRKSKQNELCSRRNKRLDELIAEFNRSVPTMDVVDLLSDILTLSATEEIKCKEEAKGRTAANRLLCHRIRYCKNWYVRLVDALKKVELDELAQDLSRDENGSLMEEVEHIAGPIHRYDKQVALQDGVEDSTASSYELVVAARLSQSPKRTYYQSLAVKQPLENIDREVRKESLRDLSGEIEKECKDVGRKLGLDESKLYQLERDYINQGHKETVYQMLLTWKRRIGSQATHRVLGEALKAAGRRDLQEKLYVQGSLMEEVEHTGPIHRYDKQVALQMEQPENYSSSPRPAIHCDENEDTLDYDINEFMKYMIFKNGKSMNNVSNNMSRKYVSNKTKHSKSFTKTKYRGYKKTKCLWQKRKGKNKFFLYKKVKAQYHVNKQCNKSIINTKDKKKTNKEIKNIINNIIEFSRPERINMFADHKINAPMPSFLCIPLNVEHNDIQDNKQINYSHDNRGSSCTAFEKVFYVFPEIKPSTPIGLFIPLNNEIKRQYDIQDNKQTNKDTKIISMKTEALHGPPVGKILYGLGMIASFILIIIIYNQSFKDI